MKENLVQEIKKEQRYKILIRNLRRLQEKENNEETNNKEVNCNQSK